ncbi:hypothetical protein ACP275_14G209100 [Erythranthe tilingii]
MYRYNVRIQHPSGAVRCRVETLDFFGINSLTRSISYGFSSVSYRSNFSREPSLTNCKNLTTSSSSLSVFIFLLGSINDRHLWTSSTYLFGDSRAENIFLVIQKNFLGKGFSPP